MRRNAVTSHFFSAPAIPRNTMSQLDYHSARLMQFWQRHYVLICAGAALLVLAVGLLTSYRMVADREAESASGRYEAMHAALREQEGDAALDTLAEFIAAEPNAYGVLAQYRRARRLYEERGEWEEASAILKTVAANGFLPQPIRDMARLSAAYVQLSHAPASEIEPLLTRLLADSHPMRQASGEAMAWALFLEGEYLGARGDLQLMVAAPEVGPSMRQRCAALLAVVQRHLYPNKIPQDFEPG